MAGTMRFIALLFVAAAVPGAGDAATILIPDDTTPCDFKAWAMDPDPKGLNVRAAPDAAAEVIARFVERTKEANGQYVEFRAHGFKNGWLLVEGGEYGDYGDPPPRTPVYKGWGWVSASLVGGALTSIDGDGLHEAPTDGSKARPLGRGIDEIKVRKILGCAPNWVKVDTDVGAGWVHSLCSNQVTTCS